jgi:hypothetical protein
MTVASAISRVSYAGNGSTTAFSVPYYFLENGHLQVILSVSGVNTVQTITTNYTVTGAGNPAGGTVTMLVAPAAGTQLTIVRDVPATQETDYTANDPFPAESHERALDKLTMLVQENDERIARAVRGPVTDSDAINMILPAAVDRADGILQFDTNGAVDVVSTDQFIAGLSGAIIGANYVTVSSTGNGVTTAFTVSPAPGAKGNIQIYLDGVYQNKATFSLSGTTVTFTQAPPLNSQIEFVIGDSLSSTSGEATGIDFTQQGTGAQTRTVANKLYEFVSVKDFGAVGDGVTDDTAAIQAAFDSGAENIYFPQGEYGISDTLILPKGVRITGANTNNYWQDQTSGSVLKAISVPAGARWTDIDGSDPTNFTPMLVLGGSECVVENLALVCSVTYTWDVGIFLPCVRRTIVENVNVTGPWAVAAYYMDLTWSDRNTTLGALHPTVESDRGANENTVSNCMLRGKWAIRIKGTDRDPATAGFTAATWPFGWGGASDFVAVNCRLSNDGVSNGQTDAGAVYISAYGTIDGINRFRFHSMRFMYCSVRYTGKYAAFLDYCNSVSFIGCKGEYTPSGDGFFNTTSNTGYCGRIQDSIARTNISVNDDNLGRDAYVIDDANAALVYYDGLFHGSYTSPVAHCDYQVRGQTVFLSWQDSATFGFRKQNGSDYARLVKSATGPVQLQLNSDSNGSLIYTANNGDTEIRNNGQQIKFTDGSLGTLDQTYLTLDPFPVAIFGCIVRPDTDDAYSLGTGGFLWSEVFAASGTINTSDENSKEQIANLEAAELAVAQSIKGLIKKFKYKNSVVKKGDGARIHVGVIAQDVKAAFEAQGLDPYAYGMFCSDTWTDEKTGEEKTRLGIRYDELLAFVLSAM